MIAGYDIVTATWWGLQAMIADWREGATSSMEGKYTNAHALMGLNDKGRRQTTPQYLNGIYDAIIDNLNQGRVGDACHVIGDFRTGHHQYHMYEGLTFGHILRDLNPGDMPGTISDMADFLIDYAPPSLWQQWRQSIYGRQ